MNSTNVALGALVITLLGIVWRGATISGKMEQTLTQLQATIAKLEKGLEQLADLPLIKQRVEQLEHNVHQEVRGRLGTIWDKLFSLQTHVAVNEARRGSSPDIDPKE